MTFIKILLIVFFNAFYFQIFGQDFKSSRIDLSLNEFDLKSLKYQDINEINIFWLSEFHGTKTNYEVSFNFFKYLVEKVGISHILLESSFLNEIYLNKYLKTGNEEFLDKIYANSNKTFSYNKESKEYYKRIYELYKTLEPEKKFDFVSLDVEHTYVASHNFIKENVCKNIEENYSLLINQIDTITLYTRRDYAFFYRDLKIDIRKNEVMYRNLLKTNFDTLNYMVNNIWFNFLSSASYDYNNIRDSLMWVNFNTRDNVLKFSTKKSFGSWGTNHTYQSKTKDKVGWLAFRIRNSHKDLNQSSTVMLYSDCEFMMPSFYIPQGLKFLFGARKKAFINVKFFNSTTKPLKIEDAKKLTENSSSDIDRKSVV